uniref:Uncharacterized protein n=1 Tax=Panagrolaimus sp. ES5 TaxID=591445 RepID=A0AC34FH67_9BILA
MYRSLILLVVLAIVCSVMSENNLNHNRFARQAACPGFLCSNNLCLPSGLTCNGVTLFDLLLLPLFIGTKICYFVHVHLVASAPGLVPTLIFIVFYKEFFLILAI